MKFMWIRFVFIVLAATKLACAANNALFYVNGSQNSHNIPFSGTLNIDTQTANSDTAILAANITVGPPDSQTCADQSISLQGHTPQGYVMSLSCSGGWDLTLVLNTPNSSSGYLTAYTGGSINGPLSLLVPSDGSEGGGNVSGTVTMVQAQPLTLSKSFGVLAMPIGATTTLTFSVTNPNTVTATSIGFTDTLPNGLIVATPNGFAGSCGGGTITAVSGSNAITLAGATLSAAASCTFTVKVTGNGEGNLTNVTSAVTGSLGNLVEVGNTATAHIAVGSVFLTSYASNLNAGESYIVLSNSGSSGAPLLGPGLGATIGNICVNVYVFDPGEEMVSCCSCLVTPDQVVNLGVNRDLTAKTLTGVIPNSVTIAVLGTLAGGDGTGASCTNSAGTLTTAHLAGSTLAWNTTLHSSPSGLATTEHPFTSGTLGSGELASLTSRCAAIIGNASTFGVCSSCRAGALGATKQ